MWMRRRQLRGENPRPSLIACHIIKDIKTDYELTCNVSSIFSTVSGERSVSCSISFGLHFFCIN